MKLLGCFIVLALFSACSLATPLSKELPLAGPCDEKKCKLPDCRCASSDIPGNLKLNDTPQFVFLTFDDAVRSDNYQLYIDELFGRKKNPDGCNVSATLFVSHDYTIYADLHDLYENGFEVALHSITHNPDTSYWREASIDLLKAEFGGQRDILTKYAKIPKEDIHGLRVPFLQLSGNTSFETIKELGMVYDCSWPTRTYVNPGLWPYTLDYKSHQDCPVGPCPTASIPGVWVAPMLDLFDEKDVPCAMVDQCTNIPKDAANVSAWLIDNFNRNYKGNKAPFGLYIHATWLRDAHIEAYKKFVDHLQTLDDVFIVGINRALQWIKNPQPIGHIDWPDCPKPKKSPCKDRACPFTKEDGTQIYMHICSDVECPNTYPTPQNPLGK